jgi:hypothetical protein
MPHPTNSYRYAVDGEGFENSFPIHSEWNIKDDLELKWLAETAAENYRDNHDGWEADWPIEITLYSLDGKDLGTFSVELEWEPSYSATQVKEAVNG